MIGVSLVLLSVVSLSLAYFNPCRNLSTAVCVQEDFSGPFNVSKTTPVLQSLVPSGSPQWAINAGIGYNNVCTLGTVCVRRHSLVCASC
jgi:hypothetical protein